MAVEDNRPSKTPSVTRSTKAGGSASAKATTAPKWRSKKSKPNGPNDNRKTGQAETLETSEPLAASDTPAGGATNSQDSAPTDSAPTSSTEPLESIVVDEPPATVLGNGQERQSLTDGQEHQPLQDDVTVVPCDPTVDAGVKKEGRVQKMKRQFRGRIEMHRQTLEENKPEVAMIVPLEDAEDEDQEMLSPAFSIPPQTELCASASLRFYGKPCKLWVLQLQDATREGGVAMKPAEQLTAIQSALEVWTGKCMEDTIPWPLHEPRVSEAMLAREAEVLLLESDGWFCSLITRLLHALRILSPDEDGPVVNALRDQYGQSCAFANVWAFFWTQALWVLIPFVLLVLVLDWKPAASGSDRVYFELTKGAVIVWGIVISALCSSRFLGDEAVQELERKRKGEERMSRKLSRDTSKLKSRKSRMLTLAFGAIPCLVLFAGLCSFTLLMMTNLILHIIFVWGDCYNLHTPEQPCRDAERTHHIFGWAAEVGCDIALAILFELFFAISSSLADWVATLLQFEYETDHLYFKSMLEVFLSALERIGFVGSLAFAFVPQWAEPHDKGNQVDMSIDCSDLFMGSSNYVCMQRRLPLEFRRWLLEKLMKGPFMVAPFIAILIKTIIPYVIYKWSLACDYCIKYPPCICCAPGRFIVRFFTLIFTLEGDNVGCFQFACKGWPFSDVSLDPSPDGSPNDSLKEYKKGIFTVLDQGVLKPFEADDELMELEMSFLWVLFFTPLKPFGVITTLAAKVLEINFDMLKMLHVRRRAFPIPDKIMRREQTAFINSVLLGSLGWTAGLSLITYNDDLHKWGVGGVLILVGMFLWLLFCAVVGFNKKMSLGCATAYAKIVLFQKSHSASEERRYSGKHPVETE